MKIKFLLSCILSSTAFAENYDTTVTGTSVILPGQCDTISDAVNYGMVRNFNPLQRALQADLWDSDDSLLRVDLHGSTVTVFMGGIRLSRCESGWERSEVTGGLEQAAVLTDVMVPPGFQLLAYRSTRPQADVEFPSPNTFASQYLSFARSFVDTETRAAQVSFDLRVILSTNALARWNKHQDITGVMALVGPSFAFPQAIFFDLVWNSAQQGYSISHVKTAR